MVSFPDTGESTSRRRIHCEGKRVNVGVMNSRGQKDEDWKVSITQVSEQWMGNRASSHTIRSTSDTTYVACSELD